MALTKIERRSRADDILAASEVSCPRCMQAPNRTCVGPRGGAVMYHQERIDAGWATKGLPPIPTLSDGTVPFTTRLNEAADAIVQAARKWDGTGTNNPTGRALEKAVVAYERVLKRGK